MNNIQLTNEDVHTALVDGYDIHRFDKRNYNDLGIDIMDLNCRSEHNCFDEKSTTHYTETIIETIDYPTTDIHVLKNIVLDDTDTADVRIQLVETNISELEEWVRPDDSIEWKVIDFKLHSKIGD